MGRPAESSRDSITRACRHPFPAARPCTLRNEAKYQKRNVFAAKLSSIPPGRNPSTWALRGVDHKRHAPEPRRSEHSRPSLTRLNAFGLRKTQPCKDLTVGVPPGQSDHIASLRRNKKKEQEPEAVIWAIA